MATSLYRKYRPQNWAGITNQNHVKVTLSEEITRGRVAHAYLFAGPRGVGKTTTARIMAKALNCEKRSQGSAEPCDACHSCEDIREGRSLDLIEIDAASNTGVDHVREHIIASSHFAPTSSPYKIFIIDEVHMLSIAAFNALLKTLEEPPSRVVFMFATTEIHKLPATIISRCQRFDFKKISREEVVARLSYISAQEGVDVPRAIIEAIAKQADGYVRDAESVLGQVLALGGKKVTLEQAELVLPKVPTQEAFTFLTLIGARKMPEAVQFLTTFFEEGGDLAYFVQVVIEELRALLVARIAGKANLAASEEEAHAHEQLARLFSVKDCATLIELLLEAKEHMPRAFILQLPLELAVVKFCQNS